MISLIDQSNAVRALRRHVLERPDQDAVIQVRDADRGDARHRSYATFDAQARRIAAELQRRYPPGSRILLLYPPVEFITAFAGCLYAGMVAVPAPLPGRYGHERRRVRGIAADAEVAAVLTDTASGPAVADWLDGEDLPALEVLATDAGEWADPDSWREPDLGHEALALLQYTSGSTGDPKGVMVSHGNLLANATALYRALDVHEHTRFGGWAPHYHDMGLMAQTLPALFLGTTCVLLSPVTFIRQPYQWLRMIDRYDVGWSAAPNFAYELCCRRVSDEQLARLDLSRWTHAVNGSEPVHAATVARFAERFSAAGLNPEAMSPCYGLAEATVFVSGAAPRPSAPTRVDPEQLARHEFREVPHGGTGRELLGNGRAPDFDVRVVDPETHEVLPAGRVGEIWLRGASVARGYWRNETATRETFAARTADGDAGYLRTGDLGTVRDGEVFVTGRLKETLILHGRNLYPQDIEHHLRARHGELGAVGAVFTAPLSAGPDGAEDAEEALVITHEVTGRPGEATLRALASDMRRSVVEEFGVRVSEVLLLRRGQVRRTTSGKIQRAEMRRLRLSGELRPEYAG
ncbi:fatty acyl-AMP ligase [Streptomyces sp. TRM68367]|uniref:fatty acyl-AMP ligase n=1 Tax=Streptomyces sp. TRM68367 TaxID=2758415 RepID=UPI00165CA720|nr:fatty acyl-AMP ligase [Streptomyces sp. TRM68367]MBC9727068.1 fatty acyl-AMP ligase [Streptomyces sp. TRM68367]